MLLHVWVENQHLAQQEKNKPDVNQRKCFYF